MRRALATTVILFGLGSGIVPVSAKKVDVGGHELRVLTRGKGPPTVVFDAGLGHDLGTWDEVWRPIRRHARVCLYDRAGLGRSDPGPLPRTSDRMVEELHTLLVRERIEPPYVLVGHSLGGLNVRLFASRYPDEVAGLVLIDPTPEGFPVLDNRTRSAESRIRLETLQELGPAAARHELESATTSAEQVRATTLPDSLPVILLSSRRREESVEFQRIWLAMQQALAEKLDARQVVAEHSGHYIQYDQPELVIEAILRLIEETRSAPGG